MTNAAKLFVSQSDLARHLGLPAGSTITRLELDTRGLDTVLELTVTGPAYPVHPRACVLQRIPLGEVINYPDDLEGWLKAAAQDDCRDCNGTGVYYGNVAICPCVNSAPKSTD